MYTCIPICMICIYIYIYICLHVTCRVSSHKFNSQGLKSPNQKTMLVPVSVNKTLLQIRIPSGNLASKNTSRAREEFPLLFSRAKAHGNVGSTTTTTTTNNKKNNTNNNSNEQ